MKREKGCGTIMTENGLDQNGFVHQAGGSRRLSDRELEVVNQLVLGRSTAEIAEKLDVGERTVYGYIESIKQKLDLTSRAELLRYVREHGLK
jgi:DNA-binding CsgD family transcriptional regulator